eukprot:7379326-Prymnesium_polylepis.2
MTSSRIPFLTDFRVCGCDPLSRQRSSQLHAGGPPLEPLCALPALCLWPLRGGSLSAARRLFSRSFYSNTCNLLRGAGIAVALTLPTDLHSVR